ncbi:MAG: enoyl-CoA hydratase family protein [Candidatus Eremiobacteraeota bacterium]|nr:enoyl-CoA hydratase family protein [Candidatus Eremiobacteraeota bacterium]MBV8499332.1 enoyl-CoA hydratase family protein [Candidatus Eremiobacteraeota bacterium]
MTKARYEITDGVLSITLDGPAHKNALTFELYGELRDRFRSLPNDAGVKAVVLTGASGDFCSGGDVGEIIGPLTRADAKGLMEFTQMTGDVVKAMTACPQPIVAAVDGACAGAGAILAMASDLRFGTERSRVAFLFVRVGLAGSDMGACAMLPRIVGLGRAAELLYTGRSMSGTQAHEWGFYNELCAPIELRDRALEFARTIARGPTLAHAMTKRMLKYEWALPLDEAVDAEASAQATCMETNDFRRAYEAFMAKRAPKFEGN